MIHGYHAIFGTYGFWLPNDPRGSWSDFVSKWELAQFGKASKSADRKVLTPDEKRMQREAKKHLKYTEVMFNGQQALAVATGFRNAIRKSAFTVWACSILPQHVHLVLGRHNYEVEQIANLMRGEATKQLRSEQLDPLAGFINQNGKRPSPWAAGMWKVFLDSEEAIENAIHYVNQNPIEEGKPQQNWSFVEPFRGLDKGWVTYR